jgi:hypothetical protein
LGDFSQLGRLLKVDGDFLKKKIRPKNGYFCGNFRPVKNRPKFTLIREKICQKMPFLIYFS